MLDHIRVWKPDRLARSVKQLIETVEDLRARGIGFRSLTEAIDTTTAQGLLIFHMFSALAEFERSLVRRLKIGSDKAYTTEHPGEVMGYPAHGHPFLDGNGSTIMVAHAEPARRAGIRYRLGSNRQRGVFDRSDKGN